MYEAVFGKLGDQLNNFILSRSLNQHESLILNSILYIRGLALDSILDLSSLLLDLAAETLQIILA